MSNIDKEADIADMLSDEVDEILANHQPKELSPDRVRKIDEYLDSI